MSFSEHDISFCDDLKRNQFCELDLRFLISSAYGFVNKFPFSTYGESMIILFQSPFSNFKKSQIKTWEREMTSFSLDYVVVYLMYHYTTGINFNFLLLLVSSLSFLFAAVTGVIPFRFLQALQVQKWKREREKRRREEREREKERKCLYFPCLGDDYCNFFLQ